MGARIRRSVTHFAALLLTLAAAAPALADAARSRRDPTANWVRHWNRIAIDASGLDHTPPAPGEQRAFAEQLGPGRASRAMAIVHIAIFDALNAIDPRYESYTRIRSVRQTVSAEAAVSQAAHDTLVALFPAQGARMDQALVEALDRIPNGAAKGDGIALGRRAARAILALRAHDGSETTEPLVDVEWPTSDAPGHWRQDPISRLPIALGAHWGEVAPFVLDASDQFRAPPPPALDSAAYAAAFAEAQRVGGDGTHTPTERTPEQTQIGIYWAYDGTPSLCAPPRLYNQITMVIAQKMGTTDALDLARVLALVNTAMADAGITIWESKYHYDLWRPVTGIREAGPGTGPSGLGDGNSDTHGDPNFHPLGAPASNTGPTSVDFTPPFPSYPSGHAGFGGALFQTLRRIYRTDRIAFTFVSDEFNGVTAGNDGVVRPLLPRSFRSLSQAEEENGQSRIYLGIHWAYDKTEGIAQGRRVADFVFDHSFGPRRR